MNESGINSFEEFLLLYLFAGLIIGALWVILEADVLLGPVDEAEARRRRRLRITRALAPLGVAHIGFALLAASAARRDPEDHLEEAVDGRCRRATVEARIFLVLGLVAVGLAATIPWQ